MTVQIKSGFSHVESCDTDTILFRKMTYKMARSFRTEESFSIDAENHIIRHPLHGVKVNILVDAGSSKCFMSKSFYLNHRQLHQLLKYTTKVASI